VKKSCAAGVQMLCQQVVQTSCEKKLWKKRYSQKGCFCPSGASERVLNAICVIYQIGISGNFYFLVISPIFDEIFSNFQNT
jgi:hypothetical protein